MYDKEERGKPQSRSIHVGEKRVVELNKYRELVRGKYLLEEVKDKGGSNRIDWDGGSK